MRTSQKKVMKKNFNSVKNNDTLLSNLSPDTLLTSKEVEALFSISKHTLLNWRKEGKIPFKAINQRKFLYVKEDIERLIGFDSKSSSKHSVLYVRISSKKYSGHIEKQKAILIDLAVSKGKNITKYMIDVASPFAEREQYNQLVEMIYNNEVENIFITSPDRISYFEFTIFETLCERHNVNLFIASNDNTLFYTEETLDDLNEMLKLFALELNNVHEMADSNVCPLRDGRQRPIFRDYVNRKEHETQAKKEQAYKKSLDKYAHDNNLISETYNAFPNLSFNFN